MMIVGFTGPAQSGKSTAAKYLVENYGFQELSFSEHVLQPILEDRGEPVTKMNMSKLGDELREKEGMDALAKHLLEKIDSPRIVISNFRSPEEVQFFIDRTTNFHLIKMEAEPDTRFKRRNDLNPDEITEFLKRDKKDIANKGMGLVFDMADFKIDNNGPIEHLYERLDEIMEDILPEESDIE